MVPGAAAGLYVGLLWAEAAAAVAMTLGLVTRLATATTLGSSPTTCSCRPRTSTTTGPTSSSCWPRWPWRRVARALGRRLAAPARGLPPLALVAPAWPLWLLRFEAAVVYGASGLSKLVDPDWFGGTVTWHRVVRVRDQLDASPLPGWAIDVLTDRSFHTYAAKVIVLTEIFIALGLWWRATRDAAVWVAVCFHITIQLTARVEVFSYLAIAALVIWAVPSTRDRVLVVDPLRPGPPPVGGQGQAARLARPVPGRGRPARRARHGPRPRRAGPDRAAAAVALALSRLPLTAWPALPATVLPSAAPCAAP